MITLDKVFDSLRHGTEIAISYERGYCMGPQLLKSGTLTGRVACIEWRCNDWVIRFMTRRDKDTFDSNWITLKNIPDE